MEIGELRSKSLEDLFIREKALVEKFNNYCRQHSKNLEVEYFISASITGAALFTLKFKIHNNNGNNGEITSSQRNFG